MQQQWIEHAKNDAIERRDGKNECNLFQPLMNQISAYRVKKHLR